jgi:predicted porin
MYRGTNKQSAEAGSEDDLKLRGHQISVTYSMSKRTTVYAFMGQNKAVRTGDNEESPNRKLKGTQVGIMHAF